MGSFAFNKIGIDATPLHPYMTGVGMYLFHLLQDLIPLRPQDHFYLFTYHTNPLVESFKRFPNVTLQICGWFGFSEALWSQTTLSWLCFKERIDLFWGATQSFPLVCRGSQKNVITIHDFAYLLHPKTVSRGRGFFLRRLGSLLYSRAEACIANSEATAEKLSRFFAIKAAAVIPPPIKVSTPAPDESCLAQYGVQKKSYYLIINTLEPRKNILAAAEAYCSLCALHPLDPLLIVGKKGWRCRKLIQRLTLLAHTFPDHLKLIPYLSQPDLTSLLRGAKALIVPSLYEGYGMPIAEARMVGVPVICTDTPEMREAAENDALFLPLPQFKETLQHALQTTLSPPKTPSYPSCLALSQQLSNLMTSLATGGTGYT